MKKIILLALSCIAFFSIGKAQNTVVDTHPTASIFAIDYSTGREALQTNDIAILFKNSLIDLVSNTMAAKLQLTKIVPGKKAFVVTQMDPQTNGNAYQLSLQSKFLSQLITIYTFTYNVDANTLYYYDTQAQNYVPIVIQANNSDNYNNCIAYGKFNVPQDQVADASLDTTPIDADVSVDTTPPPLPDYEQPECPVDGYLWQPGYWAYGRDVRGYYWVPGAWVAPPNEGLLWTPPYWGFDNGFYRFHGGYWGPTIGFYGGVNYGFGYAGIGFGGGNWYGGRFRYNTAVVRVNERVVHNVYIDRTVIVVGDRNRASFNGRGGIVARPNNVELAAMRERHVMATPEQIRNQRLARADKGQFAAANGGRPANVATPRVVEARPATGRTVTNGGTGRGDFGNGGRANTTVTTPNTTPASTTPANTTTTNPNTNNGDRRGMNGGGNANPNMNNGDRRGMNGGNNTNPVITPTTADPAKTTPAVNPNMNNSDRRGMNGGANANPTNATPTNTPAVNPNMNNVDRRGVNGGANPVNTTPVSTPAVNPNMNNSERRGVNGGTNINPTNTTPTPNPAVADPNRNMGGRPGVNNQPTNTPNQGNQNGRPVATPPNGQPTPAVPGTHGVRPSMNGAPGQGVNRQQMQRRTQPENKPKTPPPAPVKQDKPPV